MVHLLSGMQCITGINAVPDQAYSIGGIYRWKDGRNMPDVQTTTFLYRACAGVRPPDSRHGDARDYANTRFAWSD